MTSETMRTAEAAVHAAEPGGAPTDPGEAREPTSRPRPSHRTRLAVNIVLGAASVVLVGGIAFAAGRGTAPGTVAATDEAGSGVVDGGLMPGGPAGQIPGGVGDNPGGPGTEIGGMTVRGTVQAVDADSITIELTTGTTVTIAIDSATDYHRQADAAASDASIGATVIVELDGLGLRLGSGATAADVTIVP